VECRPILNPAKPVIHDAWICINARGLAVAMVAAMLTLLAVGNAHGQPQETHEKLLLTAVKASTWTQGQTSVILLRGPLTMDLDQTHMSAANAVVWLTPVKGAVLLEKKIEIALLGDAVLTEQEQITRSAENLLVTGIVRGAVRMTADDRRVENLEDSELYRLGDAFRPAAPTSQPTTAENWLIQRPWMLPPPASQPVSPPAPKVIEPILFHANSVQILPAPPGGHVNVVLSGDVTLIQKRASGEVFELRAENCVLFTSMTNLRQSSDTGRFTRVEDAITSAYLEGDVRMNHNLVDKPKAGQQRLTANRVFYDFATDRAVLTTAVMHTQDPKSGQPLITRAQAMRQLSEGEYKVQNAVLTTSSFATPSYAIGVRKAYIREIDSGDPRYGVYSTFTATDVTMQIYEVPVFWLPAMAATAPQKGSLIRDLEFTSGDTFGTGVVAKWGLFEAMGQIPPPDTDLTLETDYFSKRGPATGLDGHYTGGSVADTDKPLWEFQGDFKSLIVDDHGSDILSRNRNDISPDANPRYDLQWQHQQFFPDDWQVQMTTTLLSDPTFMEEWFPDSFYNEAPHDTALYVKRQRDSEALTFLVSIQPNNFVTSSEAVANQFEVERLPELGYRRIGDDLAEGRLNLFSDNTLSGLRFKGSGYTLADQGYTSAYGPGQPNLGIVPGAPGNASTTGSTVYRGDFRQEMDYPIDAGPYRFVPYAIARYTPYSASPLAGAEDRVYGGAGMRVATSFWRTDDSVKSDFWDMYRLRHVIEPSINVFASADNVNADHLYIYDEQIDDIHDIEAVQFALNQRWETMRGGPDRWRSSDVFTLNLEANIFAHKPPDPELAPKSFRGLFFDSLPETSIPRDSVNGDFMWRISDTTAFLADEEYNLDQTSLATAATGLMIRRGDRLSYYLGLRYIGELNSCIASIAANYELTAKYAVRVTQSFDFGQKHNVGSGFAIIRHCDRFYAALDLRYDAATGSSGFVFNVYPEGLGPAAAQGAGTSYGR